MVATLGAFVAVAVAQGGDLVTFLQMIEVHGIEAELNPLVAHGVITLGVPIVIAAKIALVAFVVATFAIVARVHRRVAASVITLAMLAGLLGTFSNVLTLL